MEISENHSQLRKRWESLADALETFSNDIWAAADPSSSEAIKKVATFKLAYNENLSQMRAIAICLFALIDEYNDETRVSEDPPPSQDDDCSESVPTTQTGSSESRAALPDSGPTTPEEIVLALKQLGGDAQVKKIKERVRFNRGRRPTQYASDWTYSCTIQKTIEDHCPQSSNFRGKALFERIGHGRYRLMTQPIRKP